MDNLNKNMIADYHALLHTYEVMDKYYRGDQAILYAPDVCYSKVAIENFVALFVDEECNYSCNCPLTYTSKSGNTGVIKAIDTNLNHWASNHDLMLMKALEVFGKAYCLNYIDAKGRFCERILSPLNAIAYCDSDGVVQRFIHFYFLKYDLKEYHDIYYPDGKIEIYKGNTLIDTKTQPFRVFLRFVHTDEQNNVKVTVDMFNGYFDGELELNFSQDNPVSFNYSFMLMTKNDETEEEVFKQPKYYRITEEYITAPTTGD